jgi:hypothetical protein
MAGQLSAGSEKVSGINGWCLSIFHGSSALFYHDPQTGPADSPGCHSGRAHQHASAGLGASPGGGVIGVGLIGRHYEGPVGPDRYGDGLFDGDGLVCGRYNDHQGLVRRADWFRHRFNPRKVGPPFDQGYRWTALA